MGIDQQNPQSKGALQVQISPNPSNGQLWMKLNLSKKVMVYLNIYNSELKLVEKRELSNLEAGENIIYHKPELEFTDGYYYFVFETSTEKLTQKVFINQ